MKLVGTVTDVSEREATARLAIEWEIGPESRRARHTASVRIHPANVITWDDVRKIGPFVMPRDPTVRALGEAIAGREVAPVADAPEIALAAKIFDALGSTGVAFAANPRVPFSFFQGNADAPDTVSTPRETLERKSGDLPDLVALIASTMEGLGVRTALVELPGTLLLAVDVGSGVERDDSWIEHEGRSWVPLDPTALGASFGDASSRAAAMIRGAEKWTLVTIADAHALYAPLDSTAEPLPVTIDETRLRVLLEADRARLAP